MKRIGLLVVPIVFGSLLSSGQTQIAFGLKGGLNVATLGGIGEGISGNRIGYQAGAYATFNFKKLALQPEIVFSEQGHNILYFSNNVNTTYSTHLNYLNLPIMVKFRISNRLNLQAGPQLGFLLHSDGPIFKTTDGSVTIENNLSRFFKPTDL